VNKERLCNQADEHELPGRRFTARSFRGANGSM